MTLDERLAPGATDYLVERSTFIRGPLHKLTPRVVDFESDSGIDVTVVWEVDGQRVANFTFVVRKDGWIEARDLFIEPGWQRQGIYTHIMGRYGAWAQRYKLNGWKVGLRDDTATLYTGSGWDPDEAEEFAEIDNHRGGEYARRRLG